MATPDHTPFGRGYAKALSYLDGANDYWSSATAGICSGPVVDLFSETSPAYGQNSTPSCGQSSQNGAGCNYEDDLFTNFTIDAIASHDTSAGPMFIYFAPHSNHLPLEVPDAQLAKFASVDEPARRNYAAMNNYVDFHVGQVVDALKAAGMWENTIMVVTADNGGPIFGPSSQCRTCDGSAGASNYPLRGSKHSPFEGGIRSNAFVSGGLVPVSQRGTTREGLVAIEDWYRTFAGLAGADPNDERAAAAGLPPVEGYDMWPYLSGANATSPRTEVPIGSSGDGISDGATIIQGLLRADGYKILWDSCDFPVWTGPIYPNKTTASAKWQNIPLDCGTLEAPKCLFNVFSDPTEHNNLADSLPDIVAEMSARLIAINATLFSPNRGTPYPSACKTCQTVWHGFAGPFMP